MKCLGRNLDEHCCWVNGKPCQFLEENTEPGQRWTCGLRRELGSWDAVLADSRYQTQVQPLLRAKDMNCRDWPKIGNGGPCKLCGSDGNS